MRALILSAALLSIPALAQDDPFLEGDALQAEVKKNCEGGCITLNRQEVDNLYRNLREKVREEAATAYKAGKQACWKAI